MSASDDVKQPKEGQKIWIKVDSDGAYWWQPREGYGNPNEDEWIQAVPPDKATT